MEQLIYYVNPATYDFTRFNKRCREEDEVMYYYHKFPLTRYRSISTTTITLECEFCINSETGEVFVDVYDSNHNMYTPYYVNRFGGHDYIVNKIREEIHKETIKLRIEVL